MDTQHYMAGITARLQACFRAMGEGRDVSPATIYRLEGFMEAGIAQGLVDAATLRVLVRDLFLQYIGEEPHFPPGEGDVPRIPLRMRAAPVYPSTH